MYCKLPTNGKQLPAFPLKAITGIEPRPQRWEARVLPLCHRGPQQAVDQLEYLVTFNRSIAQAMARTMQDLSEGVQDFTLARRDSYLEYLHAGVKQDTLAPLHTAPIHIHSLFPDQLLMKAEEVARSEERPKSGGQRGQTDGFTESYKNPPVPRRLVSESDIPPNLSPAYTDIGSSLSRTRLAGEQAEVKTRPKTGFQLRRLPVRPQVGQGQTHTRALADLNRQDQGPVCPVRQFMSLIGLLTATEKQVHLGRLHMRPIQWHLKNNWRVPESLEKVIPAPRSLHPHLRWWLEKSNVLPGQPLHPLKHALQIFTDASKEGWGAQLNERTARGTWSIPESKLHINHLELKAVFLALKEFQDLCSNNIVLVATDNTTVVAYIKEGGMKLGSLCALLGRILSWCTRKQVTLKARHIPGRLNVIADKLSRLGQTIQTE